MLLVIIPDLSWSFNRMVQKVDFYVLKAWKA